MHKEYGYFLPEETRCKCGCGGDIQPQLRDALNRIRISYGNPIHVVSGYRCAEYNKIVGGRPNSFHIKGLAADLKLPEGNNRNKFLRSASEEITINGRGFYRTFIHIDQRPGRFAYWVG